MKLNIKKPIVFFDLETTGTDIVTDRIIEIAMIKLLPDGTKESKVQRINPEKLIPQAVTKLTGISDEDVAEEPAFSDVAQEIKDFIGDSDLAGYNSNRFDIPLLVEEFWRSAVYFSVENRSCIDVMNIFTKMFPRTLTGAYKYFCGKDLDNAHSALADIEGTLEVLEAQLDKYRGAEYKDKDGNVSMPIVNDVEQLAEFSKMGNNVDLAGKLVYNDNGEACYNFGKNKGLPVTKDLSYAEWMLRGNFSRDTKLVLREIIDNEKSYSHN